MEKPRWRKLLYIKQPYPDSYTDVTFLGEMRKNVTVRLYTYSEVLLLCSPVVQNISTIVSFLALFQLLSLEKISPILLFVLSNSFAVGAYLWWISFSVISPLANPSKLVHRLSSIFQPSPPRTAPNNFGGEKQSEFKDLIHAKVHYDIGEKPNNFHQFDDNASLKTPSESHPLLQPRDNFVPFNFNESENQTKLTKFDESKSILISEKSHKSTSDLFCGDSSSSNTSANLNLTGESQSFYKLIVKKTRKMLGEFVVWQKSVDFESFFGMKNVIEKIPQKVPSRSSTRQLVISALLFKLILLGLSPILKTLTESISTDTIWALTILAFILNTLTYDYTPESPHLKDSLALNAAIFASIMLASRLPSNAQVFGLVSLAVDWFAVFPRIKCAIYSATKLGRSPVEYSLACIMVFGTVYILRLICPTSIVILYLIVIIGGAALLPAFYVNLQRYKNEIHGPWDEASVSITRCLRTTT